MRGHKRWRRVGRQLPLTLGSRPLCSSEFPLTRRYVCGLCVYVLIIIIIIIIFSSPILSYRSFLVVLFCVWSRCRCGAHRFVMVVSTCVVSSSLALPILFWRPWALWGDFFWLGTGRIGLAHLGTMELLRIQKSSNISDAWFVIFFRCLDVVASICCVVLPLWVFLRILHCPHVLALLGDCLMVGT